MRNVCIKPKGQDTLKLPISVFVLFLLVFTSITIDASAGNFIKYGGARAAGLGQAVVSYSEAGYFQNQALLTNFDSLYIEVYSAVPYAIKEFGTHSLFVAYPLLGGVSSVQYQYFGYSSYNENKTGLAYARQLTQGLSLGVQLSWLRVSIPEPYENSNNFLAELGLSYRLNKSLTFGAHIYNPTQSKPVDVDGETPQTAIRAGVSYSPLDAVTCNLELVQFLDHKTSFRTGIDLKISSHLNVQAGYNHDDKTVCLGAGINIKGIKINTAAGYHNVLGYSPHLSIGKQF
jgi:hypothetical protein